MAAELGAIINLDDFTHIDFLEKTIGYIPETISCRYNPGGLFKISNDIMDNPGDAKYGMTTEQLFEAFKAVSYTHLFANGENFTRISPTMPTLGFWTSRLGSSSKS